jgi:hypothetical protein
MQINNPIFIVGSGRSGTTILHNLIAGHEDLAWFSNYSNTFPRMPRLAKLNNIYKNVNISKKYRKNRYFPCPSEGYKLWDTFHTLNGKRDYGSSPPFTENDVKNADVNLMKKTILDHIKYSGSPRFVNKNTRNSRRIKYLNSIFPDSNFIHIIRDGRAVVNSIINIEWWNRLELWYEDGKTVSELILEGKDEIKLAAKGWKLEVLRTMEDLKKIQKKQYIEIKYENLMTKPNEILRKIMSFLNLDDNEDFIKHVDSFNIKNMNYKYKEQLSEQKVKIIEEEINPLLKKFNY